MDVTLGGTDDHRPQFSPGLTPHQQGLQVLHRLLEDLPGDDQLGEEILAVAVQFSHDLHPRPAFVKDPKRVLSFLYGLGHQVFHFIAEELAQGLRYFPLRHSDLHRYALLHHQAGRRAGSLLPFIAPARLHHGPQVLGPHVHRAFAARGEHESPALAHLVDEPAAVGPHLLRAPQGEQRRRHVAADTHMPPEDLLGLEDIRRPIQVTYAASRGELFQVGQVYIFDYYSDALQAIDAEGSQAFMRRVTRPYLAVALEHFDPQRVTYTQRLGGYLRSLKAR